MLDQTVARVLASTRPEPESKTDDKKTKSPQYGDKNAKGSIPWRRATFKFNGHNIFGGNRDFLISVVAWPSQDQMPACYFRDFSIFRLT